MAERRLASPYFKGHSKANTVKVMQTLKQWIMTKLTLFLPKSTVLTRNNQWVTGYYSSDNIYPRLHLTNVLLWLETTLIMVNAIFIKETYFY